MTSFRTRQVLSKPSDPPYHLWIPPVSESASYDTLGVPLALDAKSKQRRWLKISDVIRIFMSSRNLWAQNLCPSGAIASKIVTPNPRKNQGNTASMLTPGFPDPQP